MSETEPVFGLKGELEYEETIRKSRFITYAAPVVDVRQALEWVERKRHAAASHNCWAYRLGQRVRFTDDGEPGGSAGKPILAAIDGRRLDRVAVLVVRYFGGVKLGVGGLMRAYGGVAARCLQQGETLPLVKKERVGFLLPFALGNVVHGLLQRFGAVKQVEEYRQDGLWLQVELDAGRVEALAARLRDVSRGRIVLQSLRD